METRNRKISFTTGVPTQSNEDVMWWESSFETWYNTESVISLLISQDRARDLTFFSVWHFPASTPCGAVWTWGCQATAVNPAVRNSELVCSILRLLGNRCCNCNQYWGADKGGNAERQWMRSSCASHYNVPFWKHNLKACECDHLTKCVDPVKSTDLIKSMTII